MEKENHLITKVEVSRSGIVYSTCSCGNLHPVNYAEGVIPIPVVKVSLCTICKLDCKSCDLCRVLSALH